MQKQDKHIQHQLLRKTNPFVKETGLFDNISERDSTNTVHNSPNSPIATNKKKILIPCRYFKTTDSNPVVKQRNSIMTL